MKSIILSPQQVADYLILCFYRPDVFPDEQDAAKIRSELLGLVKDGYIDAFPYRPPHVLPTLENTFGWSDSPQGYKYWYTIHKRIMETNGYSVKVERVLTPDQKKILSSPETLEDTREIV